MIELRPSEIRYSQSTISTVFDRKCPHPRKPIEDTLNAICEGKQSISSIPSITVCRYNDQWYTRDNRRLWVFKHLEALDKCTTISVYTTERSNVDNRKFTTSNEGISVGFFTRYASEPSGHWYKKAESLLSAINDHISQSASKSGNEADSHICGLETGTCSDSNSISTDAQDSADEQINSTLESSKSNSNGDHIPKIANQEDSTIKIGCPEDHSSLDLLDECNGKADRKGRLEDVDQRSDQVQQLDQCQKGDKDQSQNEEQFVCHEQKSTRDQLGVSQTHDHSIQDERRIMKSSGHEVESSLKRSCVGVEEDPGCLHAKLRRTKVEQQTD